MVKDFCQRMQKNISNPSTNSSIIIFFPHHKFFFLNISSKIDIASLNFLQITTPFPAANPSL